MPYTHTAVPSSSAKQAGLGDMESGEQAGLGDVELGEHGIRRAAGF